MNAFQPDSRLAADTIPVGELPLCRVLLMNDARYPWLILVPRQPDLEEIIDLDADDRALLMEEIAAASEALRDLFQPLKINVGALGNNVRQLHVHVLARFESDEAWPGPVWGVGKAVAYPPHMSAVLIARITAALAPYGLKEA